MVVNVFKSFTVALQASMSPGTTRTMPKHAIWWLTSLTELRSLVSASAYLAHPANVVLATIASSMLSSVLHSALDRLRAIGLTPFKVVACASHDEKGVDGLRSTLMPRPMCWHSNPAVNGVVVGVEVGVVVTVVVVVVVDSVVVVDDTVVVVEVAVLVVAVVFDVVVEDTVVVVLETLVVVEDTDVVVLVSLVVVDDSLVVVLVKLVVVDETLVVVLDKLVVVDDTLVVVVVMVVLT